MRIVLRRKLFANAKNKSIKNKWEILQGALNDARNDTVRKDGVKMTAQDKSVRSFRRNNAKETKLLKDTRKFQKAKKRNDAMLKQNKYLIAKKKTT